MKIVLAPDSFKESVTAAEAASAMARGVRTVVPDAECIEVPMSDGGEGFTEAVAAGIGARVIDVDVHDALGRPARGTIAVGEGIAAFEVASAVGLDMVETGERDIMRSSSRGVGELLLAAVEHVGEGGQVVVGLGGSATNDGGAGMLAALGAQFLDSEGRELEPHPAGLRDLARIDLSGLDPAVRSLRITAACDVTNPLTGERGASAVFGPQKGADADTVRDLDSLLDRLARTAQQATDADAGGKGPASAAAAEGAGAAGGLGWSLMAFLGALMEPGVDLVCRTVDLAGAVRGADLVLTGEGSVDAQTLDGKTPAGVARVAAEAGVPCVVLAGRVVADADVLLEHGVSALVGIVPGAVDLRNALAAGAENLERSAATVVRLARLGI